MISQPLSVVRISGHPPPHSPPLAHPGFPGFSCVWWSGARGVLEPCDWITPPLYCSDLAPIWISSNWEKKDPDTLALLVVGPFQIWTLATWVDRFTPPLVRDLAVKVGFSSPSLTITVAVLAGFRPLAGYPLHRHPHL